MFTSLLNVHLQRRAFSRFQYVHRVTSAAIYLSIPILGTRFSEVACGRGPIAAVLSSRPLLAGRHLRSVQNLEC